MFVFLDVEVDAVVSIIGSTSRGDRHLDSTPCRWRTCHGNANINHIHAYSIHFVAPSPIHSTCGDVKPAWICVS